MNRGGTPTFLMGKGDLIADEATVGIVTCAATVHVLHNEATMRALSAIVDSEMEEVRDFFASEGPGELCVIGDGDRPMITRVWRGQVFAWSFANNMWQLALSHTEAKERCKGHNAVALTSTGHAFLYA
jgi:hypothetical protein